MRRKLFGIGETVLDLIFKDNQPVAAKAGGSVQNCMVSLGRCGLEAYFISEIGKDQIGDFIIDIWKNNGIYTDFVQRYDEGKTALALAFLNSQNDASYSFYKAYPSKRFTGSIPEISSSDILFFGSFYGVMPEIRSFVVDIVTKARNAGALVVYDPNYRRSHLHELDVLRPMIIENMQMADIVRGSNEDFELIFGTSDFEETYKVISQYCDCLAYTKSTEASFVRTKIISTFVPTKKITPISTIGAGDNFNAGMVHGLLKEGIFRNDLQKINKLQWQRILSNGIDFATEVCLSMENYVSTEFAEKQK